MENWQQHVFKTNSPVAEQIQEAVRSEMAPGDLPHDLALRSPSVDPVQGG